MKDEVRHEHIWPKPDIVQYERKDSLNPWHPIKFEPWNEGHGCLHDRCEECHGSGRKADGSPCVHMISCPCPRCSPWRMQSDCIKFVDYGGDNPLQPQPREDWSVAR